MIGRVWFFLDQHKMSINLYCHFFVFYSGAKMELVPTIALVQVLMVGFVLVLLVYLQFFLDVEITCCRSSLNKQ